MSEHPAVTFLLAAHAEAERCATTASDGQGWWLISPRAADHRSVVEYVIEGERGPVTHIDVDEHEPEAHLAEALLIQSNSPGSVLRRIEAEREILAACRAVLAEDGWEYTDAPELAEVVTAGLAEAWGWEAET